MAPDHKLKEIDSRIKFVGGVGSHISTIDVVLDLQGGIIVHPYTAG